MKLKHLIVLIVIASVSLIVYGFSLQSENEKQSHKFIGFGTVGLFFVAMPLFLAKESRGKKMQDYMLTKENIEKMRKKERDTSKK